MWQAATYWETRVTTVCRHDWWAHWHVTSLPRRASCMRKCNTREFLSPGSVFCKRTVFACIFYVCGVVLYYRSWLTGGLRSWDSLVPKYILCVNVSQKAFMWSSILCNFWWLVFILSTIALQTWKLVPVVYEDKSIFGFTTLSQSQMAIKTFLFLIVFIKLN